MRIKVHFVLILFFGVHSLLPLFGQTNGIRFNQGDLQKIKSLAKGAKKPIFLEIYLNGCPHCEAIKPILAEKEVGNFYNPRFINWKVEANSEESKALQKSLEITYPEFPMFIFLDAEGKLIHFATPSERSTKQDFVEEVISHGKIALNPSLRTETYAERFKKGERDLMFLINFGKYAKMRKDNQQLVAINDALAQIITQPADMTSQAGFYVLQRLVNDYENPLAQYFFNHLDEFRAKYPAKEVQEAGESILYQSLYGLKGDTYSVKLIQQMRESMEKLGVSPQAAASRTLLKELEAYFRSQNTLGAVKRFNEYRKSGVTVGAADYAYLMRYFNEKATESVYLPEMPLWAVDALNAVSPQEQTSALVADIYLELSVAYQKMNKKEMAISSIQKGLEIAKNAKVDTKKYEAQLQKLKML